MKKILFVINNMNIGGVPKSLVELLKCISCKYEISLYCADGEGAMLNDIPDDINILPACNIAKITEYSVDKCKKMGVIYYLLRVVLSSFSKSFGKNIPAKVLLTMMGKIKGEYDVAVSFVQPVHDKQFYNLSNEIVLKKVNAKRKITFVHCDFISYGGNTKYNRNLYKKFDAVAAVSDSVGKRFLEANEGLKDKVFTVLNCCDFENVAKLSEVDTVNYEKKTFVTVARLGKEKGHLRCVEIFSRLKSEGYDFEWHLIGGGDLEKVIKRKISELGMSDCIFLEGEQTNPYRYMKNADWFLLPSYHEAAPMVYNESACLKLPMLTTNTLSAVELVENRGAGEVCDNTDEAIYIMLKKALDGKIVVDFKNFSADNKNATLQFDYICKGEYHNQ